VEAKTMKDEIQTLLEDIPNRQLLRPTEVATFLGVSTKTVYRWCDMGLIESVKLNGSIRVLRDSLVNFLDDSRQSDELNH
jgi:excisionase family DNA binding protein